jgi:hypothetical protein
MTNIFPGIRQLDGGPHKWAKLAILAATNDVASIKESIVRDQRQERYTYFLG